VTLFHDTPAYAGVHPVGVLIGGTALAVLMVVPIPYPKVRRGSPMRLPSAVTAAFAALVLVLLQFHPATASGAGVAAEVGAYGLLVGVALYYIAGPFTVRRPPAVPG
jgi:phosphatidylserine synthase